MSVVSKEDDSLVILVSRERYLKRATSRCTSVHAVAPLSYYAYTYRMKIILCGIKLCIFSLNRKAQN